MKFFRNWSVIFLVVLGMVSFSEVILYQAFSNFWTRHCYLSPSSILCTTPGGYVYAGYIVASMLLIVIGWLLFCRYLQISRILSVIFSALVLLALQWWSLKYVLRQMDTSSPNWLSDFLNGGEEMLTSAFTAFLIAANVPYVFFKKSRKAK